MNVSDQILQTYLKYGGSDNTSSENLSASKSLNYSNGTTINSPAIEKVSTAGSVTTYSDSVGLMGPENYFVRYDLNIIDSGNNYIEEEYWTILSFSIINEVTVNTYEGGVYDTTEDTEDQVNEYYSSNFTAAIPNFIDGVIKISLENLKTNNIYLDDWLDTRLYTQKKEEHPHDTMYVGLQDSFYIGFHARNTRRLPYNVRCSVTNEIKSARTLSSSELDYMAR